VKLARLYVIPVQKDGNGKREPRKLTTDNYQVEDFDWSSDGSRIAFGHVKSPLANDWPTSDVSIVDVASGNVSELANSPAAETSPLYSPDGKSIAILVSDAPPSWTDHGVIQIFSTSGGQSKILATSFDAQPDMAGWSSDGKKSSTVLFPSCSVVGAGDIRCRRARTCVNSGVLRVAFVTRSCAASFEIAS